MMFGKLSEEVEVQVTADKAWQLYGTIKLGDIAAKHILDSLEVIEGDGGVGTIIKITFKPGSGISHYKEKYTMINNENRVREVEIIEGGYLDFRFTLYRVRIEVKEKTGSSCLVKTTIEYEVKEEAAANASLATIEPFVVLMKLANEHILSST